MVFYVWAEWLRKLNHDLTTPVGILQKSWWDPLLWWQRSSKVRDDIVDLVASWIMLCKLNDSKIERSLIVFRCWIIEPSGVQFGLKWSYACDFKIKRALSVSTISISAWHEVRFRSIDILLYPFLIALVTTNIEFNHKNINWRTSLLHRKPRMLKK